MSFLVLALTASALIVAAIVAALVLSDHERLAVYVWRSVRADGDTKTDKSRRTLELPEEAARALRAHHARQVARRLKAGQDGRATAWCSAPGTGLR